MEYDYSSYFLSESEFSIFTALKMQVFKKFPKRNYVPEFDPTKTNKVVFWVHLVFALVSFNYVKQIFVLIYLSGADFVTETFIRVTSQSVWVNIPLSNRSVRPAVQPWEFAGMSWIYDKI